MAQSRTLLRSPWKVKGYPLDYFPSKDAEYVLDWTSLQPGERVVSVERDAHELQGQVDVVTADGTILWLHTDSGAGRRLVSLLDGGFVWRVRATS